MVKNKYVLRHKIAEIKQRISDGETYRGLARYYGVTHRSIRLVVLGQSYNENPKQAVSTWKQRQQLFLCVCGNTFIQTRSRSKKCPTCYTLYRNEYLRVKALNRYAKIKHCGGSFTVAEWRLILWLFSNHCFYCWISNAALEKDHYIPINRGGSNYIENIVPACRRCNRLKSDLLPDDFLEVLWQ